MAACSVPDTTPQAGGTLGGPQAVKKRGSEWLCESRWQGGRNPSAGLGFLWAPAWMLALRGAKAKGREGAGKPKMGMTYKWVRPSPWLQWETRTLQMSGKGGMLSLGARGAH